MTFPFTLPTTIAVVGLSDDPNRPSYRVAKYLLDQGCTIIPINPQIASVLGQRAYPSLSALPPDLHFDVLDVFRKSDAVPALIRELLTTHHRPYIWLQEGVISEEGAVLAKAAGLSMTMDRCIMKEHYLAERAGKEAEYSAKQR